jgi:nitrogen regulatory protein PII
LQVFKVSIEKNFNISIEKEAEKMSTETKFDLIVSVVNQGYSDEFMTVAREAGASGGTVINARGIVHQGPVKFFGISVQDEKEIITILATREKKAPIMQAVSQAFGINTKAGGIIFSLPVDGVAGLDLK